MRRLWVQFLLWGLIISFSLSGIKAKRGFKFRHSTHTASRIHQKVGNGSGLMRTKCLHTRFPEAKAKKYINTLSTYLWIWAVLLYNYIWGCCYGCGFDINYFNFIFLVEILFHCLSCYIRACYNQIDILIFCLPF